LDNGSVSTSLGRSVFPRITYESIFPAKEGGTYGLRVVYDLVKDEVFNAYPFQPAFPVPAFG
jgi:hypothetical protein